MKSRALPLSITPIACLGSLVACGDQSVPEPRRLTYELVASTPHDPFASTQGLLLHEGVYYESTGGYGKSTLRRVEPASGKVLQIRDLPPTAFGEGLALRGDRLYQLEWKSGKGFFYDRETFERVGDFRYEAEGWGLAWDGTHFLLSDGTDRLRFLDPETFAVVRTVNVRNHLGPVDQLNELEFINGKVYANLWHQDEIVVIDPDSGHVEASLNLTALERPRPSDPEAVLNGIAWDPAGSLLHVTGKRWTRVHVLRIRE
jgi:glutamine cyclotransferase